MEQEMRCKNCGGDKFKYKGNGLYRCLYCGGTIVGPSKPEEDEPSVAKPELRTDLKDRNTALLLALFLGGLGIHKFYLRQPGWGIVYLLFCWTQIPMIVAFIEFIIMISESKEVFDRKYNHL